MIRIRTLALASALSMLACSDVSGPGGTGTGTLTPPPPPELEFSGRISVSRNVQDFTVSLTTREGNVLRLIGNQAAFLASVDQADVVIRGNWEAAVLPPDTSSNGPDRSIVANDDEHPQAATPANARFIVYAFEVTAMFERVALDGILELTIYGYALRLANGEVRLVTGCPESIAEYLGMRLWVVGSEDEPPFAFGVITAM